MIDQYSPEVSTEQTHKLERLADSNTAILFEAKTAFPFKLFPAEVTVTRSKISVINRLFFFSKEQHSLLVSDVVRIEVEEAALLATVNIYDASPNGIALQITHLWKADAHQLRRFVEGLMIANTKGIDITKVADQDVVDNVETLGETMETSSTVDQT